MKKIFYLSFFILLVIVPKNIFAINEDIFIKEIKYNESDNTLTSEICSNGIFSKTTDSFNLTYTLDKNQKKIFNKQEKTGSCFFHKLNVSKKMGGENLGIEKGGTYKIKLDIRFPNTVNETLIDNNSKEVIIKVPFAPNIYVERTTYGEISSKLVSTICTNDIPDRNNGFDDFLIRYRVTGKNTDKTIDFREKRQINRCFPHTVILSNDIGKENGLGIKIPGEYQTEVTIGIDSKNNKVSVPNSNKTKTIVKDLQEKEGIRLTGSRQGSGTNANKIFITVSNNGAKNLSEIEFISKDLKTVFGKSANPVISDGAFETRFEVKDPIKMSEIIISEGAKIRGIFKNGEYTNIIDAPFFLYPLIAKSNLIDVSVNDIWFSRIENSVITKVCEITGIDYSKYTKFEIIYDIAKLYSNEKRTIKDYVDVKKGECIFHSIFSGKSNGEKPGLDLSDESYYKITATVTPERSDFESNIVNNSKAVSLLIERKANVKLADGEITGIIYLQKPRHKSRGKTIFETLIKNIGSADLPRTTDFKVFLNGKKITHEQIDINPIKPGGTLRRKQVEFELEYGVSTLRIEIGNLGSTGEISESNNVYEERIIIERDTTGKAVYDDYMKEENDNAFIMTNDIWGSYEVNDNFIVTKDHEKIFLTIYDLANRSIESMNLPLELKEYKLIDIDKNLPLILLEKKSTDNLSIDYAIYNFSKQDFAKYNTGNFHSMKGQYFEDGYLITNFIRSKDNTNEDIIIYDIKTRSERKVAFPSECIKIETIGQTSNFLSAIDRNFMYVYINCFKPESSNDNKYINLPSLSGIYKIDLRDGKSEIRMPKLRISYEKDNYLYNLSSFNFKNDVSFYITHVAKNDGKEYQTHEIKAHLTPGTQVQFLEDIVLRDNKIFNQSTGGSTLHFLYYPFIIITDQSFNDQGNKQNEKIRIYDLDKNIVYILGKEGFTDFSFNNSYVFFKHPDNKGILYALNYRNTINKSLKFNSFAAPGSLDDKLRDQGIIQPFNSNFDINPTQNTNTTESKDPSIKSPFPDLSETTIVGKAATYLYEKGILSGYPDGTFRGENPVNRAEAAKFLLIAKLGEIPEILNKESKFKDVKMSEWYGKFISNANELGIINGYGDNTFKPEQTVTTAEFLKMMAKTFNIEENIYYNFGDVKKDDWFSKYAGIATRFELFPDRQNSLRPNKALTRSEVATALYNYLSKRYDFEYLRNRR